MGERGGGKGGGGNGGEGEEVMVERGEVMGGRR